MDCIVTFRKKDSKLFDKIDIIGMKSVASCAVTAKIRTGWFPDDDLAHKLIPKLSAAGADLVTLHGRSRTCRYTGRARWDYIEECGKVAAESKVPFFGNGDVLHWEDYFRWIEEHSVQGAMIGRGALIKPWIFEEIKERKVMDPSSSQRLEMLKETTSQTKRFNNIRNNCLSSKEGLF